MAWLFILVSQLALLLTIISSIYGTASIVTVDEVSSCNCTLGQVCDSGSCVPSMCFDLEWSPDANETDVDCGGEICRRRCSLTRRCATDGDCVSKVCSRTRHICLPKECGDLELSGNETAIDCGGPQCDPCEAGRDCERNEDCLSRRCETSDRFICLDSNCEDKPCGSTPFCPRCPVGAKCEHDAQCESGHCESGICYLADCERCGVRSLCPPCSAGEPCEEDSQCASKRCSEITRTCLAEYCDDGLGRCGGLCEPCGVGGDCDSDEDCASGLKCDLDALKCSPKHCFDGVIQPDSETDIDCGGECIAKCSYLEMCKGDSDCALNGICDPDARKCIAATCINQVKDIQETDVDCGNSAKSGCLPCQRSGSGCLAETDADSSLGMVCDVNMQAVVPAHCLDNKLSGDETSVDCGGASCSRKCPPGASCHVDSDCISNDCYEGLCVATTCHNGKLDSNETDIDCGGGFCRPCSLSAKCRVDSDCASGMCSEFTAKCQPPECVTHCGGPCDPCPDSTPCSSNSDCLSGFCYGESSDPAALARTFQQMNDLKTGNFLFLDAARGVCLPSRCQMECGKGDCPGCAAGEKCSSDSECASGSCDPVKLRCHASTCFNQVKDEDESDVDCGGPMCPPCTLSSQACNTNADCASNECSKTKKKCVPLSCFNLLKDNRETDVDCGGPECNPCDFMGAGCRTDEDCTSNYTCSPNDKVCIPTTCFNGILDLKEIDVDCGMEACGVPCKDGSTCTAAADCASGICHKGTCLPMNCASECGQTDCPNKCEPGDVCERDAQCDASSVCLNSRCVNEQVCRADWRKAGASDPSGCGGSKCTKCGPHRLCEKTSDCDFGLVCDRNSKRCEFETCYDGLLSTGEICVDGGGICKRRCSIGQQCKSSFDCERSSVCDKNGVCSDQTEAEDEDLKRERERLISGAIVESFILPPPPPPPLDELDIELKNPVSAPEAPLLQPIAATVQSVAPRVQTSLESAIEYSFPELSFHVKSDIDWTLMLHAVKERVRLRISMEEDRIVREEARIRLNLFPGQALTINELCDPSICVIDGLSKPNQLIHPHVFYVLGTSETMALPDWKMMVGFFLSPGSSLTMLKGVEVQSLSVVASGATLTLGAGESKFPQGLVVERGARLVLLAGASLSGKHLLVFGDADIYGDSVLDFPESQMAFFGKISLAEPGVRFRSRCSIHGYLLLKGGSSFRTDDVVDIFGSMAVEKGQHAMLDSVKALNFRDGALFLLPSSTRLSSVAQSAITFSSTSSVASVAWLVGTLEISERSSMIVRNGSHLLASGSVELQTGATIQVAGTTSVVIFQRLQLGENTLLHLQSPALVLSPLPAKSASSVVRIENDLILIEPSSSVTRSLQGRVDFLPRGRLLMGQLITAAAVTTNTTTSATTNRVEFLGPVIVSSISEFIVGLPDRPFLELVFMAQVIFTHPIVFYSNTTLEFHSQSWLANSVENQGQFVLTSQAQMVISHTYTGAGTVSNAGSMVVLGDVLCSSRSFTGQGSVFVGSAPISSMEHFSKKIFAFLEPTGVFPCAAGSVAQKLSMSLVSTTHLLIHFCVPSAQRTGGGLLNVIRPSLDIGEPDPLLTRANGVPLAGNDALPDIVYLHPTNSQLKSILSSADGFHRKLISSTTEGGTLEFTQSAKVSVQGQVTVSTTGYMALSRKATSTFSGGFEAHGDVWIGPDTSTIFSWVVESTSNFTIEKTANVTFTRCAATFSGHLSQSGSVSCELYTNFTADGFFENHGDFFSASSTSVSFLAPHGSSKSAAVNNFGLSPVFYFTEGSILDSRGYLYFGPRTKSRFEKGSLIESSGVFILEETGWIYVTTSYLFLEGTTEILGNLIIQGRQAKAKFLGSSARISGLISAESDSLVELLSKSTYVQAPGTVQTRTKGKILHGAPQGIFNSAGGIVNGSVDFVGVDSKISWRQNSSFSCYDACQVKRTNMTLERECRMDVFGKMEMNANFRADVGSTVIVHGPHGVLHVLGGDFEILGNFTSTNGGQLILESPRILGRRDLMMDRTIVKTQLFSTSSCSGDSLAIHGGASLRLAQSATPLSSDENHDPISAKQIICSGPLPLVVEPGATLIISGHVKMMRKLVTWKDSRLVIEENGKLEIINDAVNVLSGEVVLENSAQLIVQATEVEFEGKTTLAMNALISFDSGEAKLQDGSEMMCVKPACGLVIRHRAFLALAGSASVLAISGENAFLDVQGKLKNNGRMLIAGHGTKAMLSGHYIGVGDVTVDNFAKVFVKGSYVSSFPGKFENSGGYVVFVRGSESLMRLRSFSLAGMGKTVVEETSKVSIHSDRFDFASKSKFIVSGGNVSLWQSYLQGEFGARVQLQSETVPLVSSASSQVIDIGGVWIFSHSSIVEVHGSLRLKRGARMELEGKVQFVTKSFSDFIRLETSSSLKVISGSLHIFPDLFMEAGSELIVLGSVKVFSSRFVNNGGLVSVEGKLRMRSNEASFKFGTLDILQAGGVHLENPKCDPEDVSALSESSGINLMGGEGSGYHFSHDSSIHSQGLIQLHPCARMICNAKFVSSGDIVVDVNSQLVLFASASFDAALPSTVHVEGELVVEKGSNLRWSSPGTGSATALIQVLGSLQFATAQQPVEVSFVLESSDVNLLPTSVTTTGRASIVVKDGGILSGSAQLRNCSLFVHGRLEPGDLERTGLFSVENGDFELLPGAFFETDVRAAPSSAEGAPLELVHDIVDVKKGNVRINSRATLAFAVLDVDKFDLPVVSCDARRLFWTKEDLRIAAYSVDFERSFEELSYHVYETENAQGTSLRVRVETLRVMNMHEKFTGHPVTMMGKADPMLTLGSTGTNRISLTRAASANEVRQIVERHLGGVAEMESERIIAVHCFEPFECRAFCQVLDIVRDLLAKDLGVEQVSEFPLGSCDYSRFWPTTLLPCVADGLTGTATKGELCDFPFEFQGVTYSSNCAHDEILGDWCLTGKGHWGGCVCGPFKVEDDAEVVKKRESKICKTNGVGNAPAGTPCAFPFFEDRSSHEPHYACVGTGMGGFGFCRTVAGDIGGCAESCSSPVAPPQQQGEMLHCVTNGRGTAEAGKRCHFPFEWMGLKRFRCVGSGWGSGEGFCLTATGHRGGCACSGAGESPTESLVNEVDTDAMYFVQGPWIQVLSEDSVQITAQLNKPPGGTGYRQWHVYAVEANAEPPSMPSSSLKNAVASSGSDQTVVIKNLDWRLRYDFYVYAAGFDQEDFLANAIMGVKLKPPRAKAERFAVVVKGRDGSVLELVEGGDKVELVITRNDLGDRDSSLVDVLLEPSVPGQLWLSERSFSLRKEKTIQILALQDQIKEETGSVTLHVIDVDRSARLDLELTIKDAASPATSDDEEGSRESSPLVLVSLEEEDDDEVSNLSGKRRKLMTMRGKGQTRKYLIKLASPPAHPVVVRIEPVAIADESDGTKNDYALAEPDTLVFTKQDWNKPKWVSVMSTKDAGGALFRHRVKSRDARFANALTMEMQIRILGSSPSRGHSDDSTSTDTDGQDESSSSPTALPSVAPITPSPSMTPTASPTSSFPTLSPSSSFPTLSPSSSFPTLSPSSSFPTLSPSSEAPTASPSTPVPSLSPSSATPTDSPISTAPTTSPTSEQVSSIISILPQEAYLFPKTSLQFQLYSSSMVTFKLVPKVTLVSNGTVPPDNQGNGTRRRALDAKTKPTSAVAAAVSVPTELAGLLFYPPLVELNRTSPSATVSVWMERDPGRSFAAKLSFDIKPDKGMSQAALQQLQDMIASTVAIVRYISRTPAIVLSKPTLSDVANDQYAISLSVPHQGVVTVRISTTTDSVCLDLDAKMQRPCNQRTCLRCLDDVPEVVISPRIVKFAPSTGTIQVQLQGWANNKLLEPPRGNASAPLILRHEVVQTGSGADDPLFGGSTPTVFGPGDVTVTGLTILHPGQRHAEDYGDDLNKSSDGSGNRSSAHEQQIRRERIRIEPVLATPGQFKVGLNFLARAAVAIQADGCRPDSLQFEDWTDVLFTACYLVDESTSPNPRSTVSFVVTSDDPNFDQIEAIVPLAPGAPEFPPDASKSNSDGVIIRVVVGITSSLTTLVALLVVWVFMGPRAANAWRNHRVGGRDTVTNGSMGRRSTKAGKRPPGMTYPVADDGPAAQQQHERLSFAALESPPAPLPLATTTIKHVSAVVPAEEAAVLFLPPPPEQFHVSDVVVVKYEVFEDVQFFKGRIVEEENAESHTYVVQFVDGDVDQEVDPDAMRKYTHDLIARPRSLSPFRHSTASSISTSLGSSSGPTLFYDVKLVRSSELESFGLKIGWTTNDRVVVTGFVPGTVAFTTLELQLGDEIIGMNGRKTPSSFEAAMALMRSSGTELDLRLRPARLVHLASTSSISGSPLTMRDGVDHLFVVNDEDDGHSGSGTGEIEVGGLTSLAQGGVDDLDEDAILIGEQELLLSSGDDDAAQHDDDDDDDDDRASEEDRLVAI